MLNIVRNPKHLSLHNPSELTTSVILSRFEALKNTTYLQFEWKDI